MTAETARRWEERAREAGASGARPLAASDVTLHEWALLKCRYGCPDYGRRLSCPPSSPSLGELRAALAGYRHALLVWVEVAGEEEEPAARRRLHEALLTLERDAFLQGDRKALAFGVGPCLWCGEEPCPEDGTCRHREQAAAVALGVRRRCVRSRRDGGAGADRGAGTRRGKLRPSDWSACC